MSKVSYGRVPMRVQVRAGSALEKRYYQQAGLPSGWGRPAAIATDIDPAPLEDLIFFGGKVVPQMEFQNVYLGGAAAWRESDTTSIDRAILLAMQAPLLNNVVAQYFPGRKLVCEARESFVWEEPVPKAIDEPDIQAAVVKLYDDGTLDETNLDSTLFNFILPSGRRLRLESDTSLGGLGGYHGSIHIRRGGKRRTLYYSANVFSEMLSDGRENGIVAFDRPWKNVVATLYHEINEFRTDPDVNDAIRTGKDEFLGWSSRDGSEIGDQPIFAAGENLNLVFKQVRGKQGGPRLPIQFLFSNAVHGAEGPRPSPHKLK